MGSDPSFRISTAIPILRGLPLASASWLATVPGYKDLIKKRVSRCWQDSGEAVEQNRSLTGRMDYLGGEIEGCEVARP
jgi:hypothetical protein